MGGLRKTPSQPFSRLPGQAVIGGGLDPPTTPFVPLTGRNDNGDMAEDDIERLLREIQATTSGSSPTSGPGDPSGGSTPARRADNSPAERSREIESAGGSAGGRVAFGAVAAGVTGVGAFLFGVFTPFTDALDMGFAAAVAAFLTGIVAGPPRWFSS